MQDKLIREQRENEAKKKNLSGYNGKIAIILRYLGCPIVEQSMPDVSTMYGNQEIFEYEEECGQWIVGRIFDGLSMGVNIEIIYHDISGELTLTYNGYMVYQEVSSKLECYVPFETWEKHVDYFYQMAKQRGKIVEKKLDKHEEGLITKATNKMMAYLKEKWGF